MKIAVAHAGVRPRLPHDALKLAKSSLKIGCPAAVLGADGIDARLGVGTDVAVACSEAACAAPIESQTPMIVVNSASAKRNRFFTAQDSAQIRSQIEDQGRLLVSRRRFFANPHI
jgi:hypothetical protein